MQTLYRHKKRGTTYRILQPGEKLPDNFIMRLQVQDATDDMQDAVMYVDINETAPVTVISVRAKNRFFDGRFEEINATD